MFGLQGWALAGAVVAVVGLLAASHGLAYRSGAQAERAASLTRSIEVLRQRNVTDDATRALSNADLCVRLGGLWSENRCQ